MAYVDRATIRMTDEEIRRFLAEALWARIGTVSADGEPHVSPIGIHLHEGRVYFHALRRSRRTRNIEGEQRVSLCVDTGVGPDSTYADRRGVMISGMCRMLGEADRELIAGIRPDYAERFFGNPDFEFERRSHAWFEVTPYRFASWDFGKIPAGADRMTGERPGAAHHDPHR